MITCNLLGGLGNQLFQIFTTISYALDYDNSPAFLNTPNTIGITYRTTYWNTFLIYLQKWVYPNLNSYFPITQENEFHYTKLPIIEKTSDVCLAGYFQSYKYFDKNKVKITELIGLNSYQSNLKKRLNLDFDKTVSLHFRIGDYKSLQYNHPILTDTYYRNALQYILKTTKKNNTEKELTVLYFYEQSDLLDVDRIILILKKEFMSLTFVPINQIFQDWEQMILMGCCKYNIIANSTFSWWGAYLSEKKQKPEPDQENNKIICYPSVWFGHNLKHDTKDLFPNDWTKIEVL
jgi:hypothetical protein